MATEDDKNFDLSRGSTSKNRPWLNPPFAKGNKLTPKNRGKKFLVEPVKCKAAGKNGAVVGSPGVLNPEYQGATRTHLTRQFKAMAKDYVNSQSFWNMMQARAEGGCLKSVELILFYGIGKPADNVNHRFDVNDTVTAVQGRIEALTARVMALKSANVSSRPAAMFEETLPAPVLVDTPPIFIDPVFEVEGSDAGTN